MIDAVDGDDGLAASAMLAVHGNGLREFWHNARLPYLVVAKTVCTVLAHRKTLPCRPSTGEPTYLYSSVKVEWAMRDSNGAMNRREKRKSPTARSKNVAILADLPVVDDELAEIIRCWPELSDSVRADIIALVHRFQGAP